MLLFLLFFSMISLSAGNLKIKLTDSQSRFPVENALVYIVYPDGSYISELSAKNGNVSFNVKKGEISIHLLHSLYKTRTIPFHLQQDTSLHFVLEPNIHSLKEVVVTASESKGISSSSIINREAMEHIQPTSFADIVALLPGEGAKAPEMNKANLIQLREAGIESDNYATSSLGTAFIIDGAPISTDANMQYVPQAASGTQDYSRNTTNKGVDMRTISTDEIEKVEIIRGIPSVEYGDLTSGVIMIERKLKATPWEARFKTDGFGKLFYAGKGFAFNEEKSTLNVGADYLDAKADPRNNLENYKRITASIRYLQLWEKEDYIVRWNINADYTGSIDNDKTDPDLNYMKEDSYRSTYHRTSLSNQMKVVFSKLKILESIQLNANLSYQTDRIEQTRFVSLDRDRPMQTNTIPGEHDGTYLPYTYTAKHVVDGKPLGANTKLKANLGFATGKAQHNAIAGIEWKMNKNFGDGQVFDLSRPLYVPMYTRPRTYKEIPAGHQLSFFLEDDINIPIARHQLKITAGIRSAQLLNLNKEYAMHGKMYFDPRANAQWLFPAIKIKKHDLRFNLSGGIGLHTKMPTLNQLYPTTYYKDVIQLNYWHETADYRRLNILTYAIDPISYDLQPAKNLKWEIRLAAEYNRNNFSITYFRENMNSGFRYTTVCIPYTYKKYDASGVDHENLTSPPDLSILPYTEMTVLDTYSQVTNGSKIEKEGVEFQFSSQRIKAIRTRFTLNGGWFRTTYVNSQPMYYSGITTVIDGTSVNDLYIGYYNWTDGSERKRFSTNLITDTHFEKLGLTFSLTFQFDCYSSRQTLYKDGVPVAYMDNTGTIHTYTEEDKSDIYKQWLIVEPNSEAMYNKITTPFAGYLNLKVTKTITRYIKLAFFIDKLFDYLPDYKASNGVIIRRSVTPYFGMEINIKI